VIGDYVVIGDDVEIGKDCIIGNYCEIRRMCRLGRNVSMGSRCTLSAYTQVGSNVVMKYNFVAADTVNLFSAEKRFVSIKDGARFGANVTVLAGLTIKECAVVGAKSLVTKDCESKCVYMGIPAKCVRRLRDDEVRKIRPNWEW